MKTAFRGSLIVTAAILAVVLIAPIAFAQTPAAAQAQAYRAPRTADGRPNLNGIWQGLNEANWDLMPHPANFGRVVALGAEDAVPPGIGWVEGGENDATIDTSYMSQEDHIRPGGILALQWNGKKWDLTVMDGDGEGDREMPEGDSRPLL